jgi:hypothetical protein
MSNGSNDYLMAKVESFEKSLQETKDSVKEIASEMKRQNDAMWAKIDSKASRSEVQGIKRLLYTTQGAFTAAAAYFGIGTK